MGGMKCTGMSERLTLASVEMYPMYENTTMAAMNPHTSTSTGIRMATLSRFSSLFR